MEETLNNLSFTKALLVGVVLAAVYYIFFFENPNEENFVQGVRDSIQEQKSAITKLDGKIKEIQEVQQKTEFLKDSIQKAYKFVPQSSNPYSLAQEITKEARGAGLSISRISDPQKEALAELKTVNSIQFNSEFVGGFSELMVFLSEMTRKNQVFAPITMRISNSDSFEDEKKAKENLTVTINFVTFTRKNKVVSDEQGEQF